jgi:hypothetical protein
VALLAASTVGDGTDLGDGDTAPTVQLLAALLLTATTDEELVAMKLLVAGSWRRSGGASVKERPLTVLAPGPVLAHP